MLMTHGRRVKSLTLLVDVRANHGLLIKLHYTIPNVYKKKMNAAWYVILFSVVNRMHEL